MDLNDARHVLTRTARINEGGYVADCRDLVLAEMDGLREALRNLADSFADQHPTVSTPSALREARHILAATSASDEYRELRAMKRRATDAARGNASETDEYERGWLDACAEILRGGDA